MTLLAQRYATAMFEVAGKNGVLDQVAADLKKLHGELQGAGMRALVMSPETTRPRRESVLLKIVEGGHKLTENLIQVILRRRRQEVLPDLYAAYSKLLRESRGEVLGVVETARPMDTVQHKAVEAQAQKLVGKKVSLSVRENPDLIGGVRIYVGNTLYDGSVQTYLEQLERQLMDTQLP